MQRNTIYKLHLWLSVRLLLTCHTLPHVAVSRTRRPHDSDLHDSSVCRNTAERDIHLLATRRETMASTADHSHRERAPSAVLRPACEPRFLRHNMADTARTYWHGVRSAPAAERVGSDKGVSRDTRRQVGRHRDQSHHMCSEPCRRVATPHWLLALLQEAQAQPAIRRAKRHHR